MLRKRLAAVLTAVAVLTGVGVAAPSTPVVGAPAASAHFSPCIRHIKAPIRYSPSSSRIHGYATTKVPVGGHQTMCGARVWLEVWAPNGHGLGKWRPVGTSDHDVDPQIAVTRPSSTLLFGKNYYRTAGRFYATGPLGERSKHYASRPVIFNRYAPWNNRRR